MAGSKSVKRSISFQEELLAAAEIRAKSTDRGNLSGYIQRLVQDDIDGKVTATPATHDAIANLARTFHPTLAPLLEARFDTCTKPVNQPRIIAYFLEALTEALEGDFNPTQSFSLVDKDQVNQWEKLSDERIATMATQLAHVLNREGGARLTQILGEQTPELNEPPVSHSSVDYVLDQEKARRAKRKPGTPGSTATPPRSGVTPPPIKN